MLKKAVAFLIVVVLALTGCSSGGGSSPSRGPDQPAGLPSSSEEPFIDENDKIAKEDISVTLKREKVNIAYEALSLNITNNSLYPFAWYAEYNIYEEVDGEYLLVDDDGDGRTKIRSSTGWHIPIEPGKTTGVGVLLWDIRDDDYARPGKYRLEIPINAEYIIPLDFEVVDEYIPVDTDISIRASKPQYTTKDKDMFYYTVVNNTEESLQFTVDIHIARYKNGTWERLPKSKKYKEMYHYANMYSVGIGPGSTMNQEFSLTLSGMVGKRLTPGKYRLETNLGGEWRFNEIDVVKG